MKVKVKKYSKITIKLVIKKILSILILSGASVGMPSSRMHTSMTQYVLNEVNGISVIDLVSTFRNLLSVSKLIRILIKRKHTIIIVANTADHARLASTLLSDLPNNVYVLSTRWSPGIFSNYSRYSKIVHVYKRMSDTNKTDSIVRQYEATYGPIEDFYMKSKLPRLVIFIDVVSIDTALSETIEMGIPTVGFVNTDYDNTNGKLTYILPLGSSLQASALVMIVLRNAIKYSPIRKRRNKRLSVFKLKSKRTKLGKYKHSMISRKRLWYGKFKWKKLITPLAKIRMVSKYMLWKKRSKLNATSK